MTQTTKRLGLSLLCVVVLSITAMAQMIETADGVLDRMKANTQAIEDLDAFLTVEAYSDGDVSLTQRIRLSLLQPDRMRQEYLEPDYLAGNLSLIIGDRMWIYIAAIETWYERDLAELSTAEQPWLVFRQFLRGVQNEFADYTFELLSAEGDMDHQDDITHQGDEYHIQGTAETDAAVYGRIELWVDSQTFVPNKRILYDVEGNLLVELRILEVEEVADSTYMARMLQTYDETGELKSTIHYDSITVNSGLDPTLFVRIEEPANE
ncbi:MAG: outer membrane lipoprotein-sorting protein [Candidatus Atribacteria bacterium]|nr:MAG: outer membrane lipoprotein-sorting protein [Candidatus Atribacteria bacterium]